MFPRPIRTEADYQAALSRIDALWGAQPGTDEKDELDVRIVLVQHYEDQHHVLPPADPIEAIRFAMEQRGMKPADLAPYMGSKARVSEVLNRKRPLTLGMVRALSKGLDLPLEILAREYTSLGADEESIDFSRFPVKEMVKHGHAPGFDPKTQAEEIVRHVLALADSDACLAQAASLRRSLRRSGKDDPHAVQAWLLCARAAANQDRPAMAFSGIDADFLRQTARLSIHHDGPRQAVELLRSRGIVLVVQRHFNRTYLDGAAFRLRDGTPVAALTLRHDRIDHFWFTLLHELAHIALGHLDGTDTVIVDDLDIAADDDTERAADLTAQEAIIPASEWGADGPRTLKSLKELAWRLGIHPALVAGRVRKETGNYRVFAREVGQGEIRRLFPIK